MYPPAEVKGFPAAFFAALGLAVGRYVRCTPDGEAVRSYDEILGENRVLRAENGSRREGHDPLGRRPLGEGADVKAPIGGWTWAQGMRGIAEAEYYLATGEGRVLDHLGDILSISATRGSQSRRTPRAGTTITPTTRTARATA